MLFGKISLDLELGINEAHVFQLNDAIGNLFVPIFTAGLYHTNRKAMERYQKRVHDFREKTKSQIHPSCYETQAATLDNRRGPKCWPQSYQQDQNR